jgi:hypothetical protein
VRRAAVVVLVLVASACGSGHPQAAKPAKKPAHPPPYAAGRISIPPAERDGFWRKLELSPSLKWWLGQWSGECEVQSTYLIPAHGGKPRRILAGADESEALGWTREGRAKILIPHSACGGSRHPAGIYAVDPNTLKLTLLKRVKPLAGGA